jgi:catechol 2,3-dioxygenase-like lactoylglutathione lyase family enzyme
MQSFDNSREERAGVSNWQKAISAITLFVEDKNRAKDFYAKAFDLTPLHEDESGVTLRLENVYLRLSVISEAQHSDALQIAPAAVGRPDNGPRQVFAIFVDDVDGVCRELSDRGIVLLNGPEDRSWGMRTASIQDPDENVWTIATDLD